MKTLHAMGQRGVAVVLVLGVLIVFILAFMVLAIDFAYVYVVRGQLQNAADAAALAGSALISDPDDITQFDARAEAIKYALENAAAGEDIVVVTNNTNTLSADNDITVGHWDGETYTPGGTPVNALEVRPRRTEGSPGGPVGLFFGRLIGRRTMGVTRVAVASNPAHAEAPIALCIQACGTDGLGAGSVDPEGSRFIWSPTPEERDNPLAIAFTDFAPDASVSTGQVVQFFCGKTFDACFADIATTQSAPAVVGRQFRCAFLNPLYDSRNKTCQDGSCNSVGDTVTSWSPIVPIIEHCPPGQQGANFEPYEIIAYARARILDVYIEAEGGIGSGSENNCACQALGPVNYINSPERDYALIINAIDCVDCDSDRIDELLGRRSQLVR